jgi:hypothetical protein
VAGTGALLAEHVAYLQKETDLIQMYLGLRESGHRPEMAEVGGLLDDCPPGIRSDELQRKPIEHYEYVS